MATTMPLTEFAREVLLNRCLREGPFQGPRKYGSDTALWKSLSLLAPVQQPDGTWKGDAQFFFATPVHEPLALLQTTLRDLSRQYELSPNPGEHLVEGFIPRIIDRVAEAKKAETNSDVVEMTPEHIILITPLDAPALRSLMVRVFGIENEDLAHQDEVLARAGQMVFEGFITDAYDMMAEVDQKKLEDLIEKTEDPNEIMTFLEYRIPNFDHLLASQVFRVKNEYDDLSKMMNDLPDTKTDAE